MARDGELTGGRPRTRRGAAAQRGGGGARPAHSTTTDSRQPAAARRKQVQRCPYANLSLSRAKLHRFSLTLFDWLSS